MGTTVVVSGAVRQLSNPVAGVVGGCSYGTQAQIGTTFDSGPSFANYMPCLGTSNAVRTNSGVNVNIPGIATTGTVTNTVRARVSSATTTAKPPSTVQTADILGGVITATAIQAVARGNTNGSTYTFTDTGSGFGALTIQGSSVGPTAAPGTVVQVPGVGTLTLRKVSRTSRSLTVTTIEVVLKQPVDDLPIGTVVRVGVAKVALG